jgi:hypothetical protein
MSLAGIILTLGLAGPMFSTRTELEAAVNKAGTTNLLITGKDDEFKVLSIDWSKLTAADGQSIWLDMKQSLDQTCLLNSVRFALQRRHDVMLGKRPHGDRIVWSLVFGYTPENKFATDYTQTHGSGENQITLNAKSLDKAHGWLNRLEIKANPETRTQSLEDFLNANPGPTRMLFVAGRSNSAQHNYVVYQTQPKPNGLNVKVYDPWTGKNLVVNNSDWIDVEFFQMEYALPVGLTEDEPQPGQPTYYSVLFIPGI